MKIFALIPVFNRLDYTKRVIKSLKEQILEIDVEIVVINDGSTDGTSDFLKFRDDITTLEGDGSLWWGGAIDLGLQYVMSTAEDDDYVLFLNNDTWFNPDYVATLIRASWGNGGAAVGSVIHEENRTDPLVSIGPRININRIAVWDILAELPTKERCSPKPVYPVDALSGRGTLYPVSLFLAHGGMRPKLLPHYFADYEVAMRFARDAKIKLLVSTEAIIFSPPIYGNDVSHLGFWDKFFSKRSSSNVIHKTLFYCIIGSPIQRMTAPLRIAYFGLVRCIHGKIKLARSHV